jgi:hypothetical protein
MRSSITFGFLGNGLPIIPNRTVKNTIDNPGIEDAVGLKDHIPVIEWRRGR